MDPCVRPPHLQTASIADQAHPTPLSVFLAVGGSKLFFRSNHGPDCICFVSPFQAPSVCVCLAPIHCFSDHLPEHSNGPKRIHFSDALVDIADNGLSQSHAGLLKFILFPRSCVSPSFSVWPTLLCWYHI